MASNLATGLLVSSQAPPVPQVKHKRKRFVKEWPNHYDNENNSFYDQYGQHEDDSDFEDEPACEEAFPESVGSSSSSASSCDGYRVTKVKHGHKILITEEKMTEALKDLQIEIENVEHSMPPPTIESKDQPPPAGRVKFCNDYDFGEDDSDPEEDTSANGILISDELKAKLREYSFDKFLMSTGKLKKDKTVDYDLNKLQLVVWSPRAPQMPPPATNSLESSCQCSSHSSSSSSMLEDTSSSAHTNPANFYQVEEPSECVAHKNNRLKRKYSQLIRNQISIEEVQKTSLPTADQATLAPTAAADSFYLVDDVDEDELAKTVAGTAAVAVGTSQTSADEMGTFGNKPAAGGSFQIVELPDVPVKSDIAEEDMEM